MEENTGFREEIIEKGVDPFIDSRGIIDNYKFPEPITWIGLIKTNLKEGEISIRANHFHPIQEQKVLVISGEYISVYKDLTKENAPIKSHLVGPGDLVITPPNIAHAQIFLKDTILLNLVQGEREHGNYGKHTKPTELVTKEMAKKYIEQYKNA